MKNYLIVLLLLISCITFAAPENEFPNGALIRDGSNASTDILGNIGAYSKSEMDNMLSGIQEAQNENSLKYYFTKEVAITGYRYLLATAPAIATEAASFTVSSTTYVQSSLPHVSKPMGVATFPRGEITIIRFMSNNQSFSSGRNADYVSEVYFADDVTYENETFVATFTNTNLIGQSIQTLFCKATLNYDVPTGGVTRVMLVKHYWKRTGVLTSNNPVITVYCGGQYAGYISTQLPSAVTMRTDGSNADPQVNFNNASFTAIQGLHIASDSSIGSTSNILIDGHTLVFKDGLFIQYIPKP